MRTIGFTLLSVALTAAVIGNAFYQKKQFYPSVVYITKSNPCMAVIYIQAFVLVILTGKLMRKVFFGQLRAAEFEHLMERSWYAVTETCLAFTVFRDDFSPKFVALFTVLLFLKSFHWLAEDRVDFMERSPVISWLFHMRVLALLIVLGSLDIHFVGHAYQSTVTKGASVQLVFGFEYAILLTIILNISIKYVLHTLDLQSDNPWENKAVFLLYTELAMGFIKVLLYVTFVAIMVRIYTLPLFALRPMYYTMRSFNKAFNDVILSRRAIRNMNTLYPDATPEELSAADNVCIICREEMVTASKKLPCNHIFHTSCLRSWFQRQQTCPTCRLNILQAPQVPAAAQQQGGVANAGMPGQAQPHPAPAQPQPAPGMNPFMPVMAGAFRGGVHPFWPMQMPGPQQQQQQQQQATVAPPTGQTPGAANPGEATPTPGTSTTTMQPGASTSQNTSQMSPPSTGTMLPFLYPPFPMIPFMVPPPLPPRDWSGLSDAELRALEGTTREAVEARLRVLHQVQLMLDAAAVMANQCATAAPQTQNSTFVPTTAATSSTNVPSVETASSSQESAVAAPTGDEAAAAGEASSSNSSCSGGAETNTEGGLASSLEQEEVRRRRLQKFMSTTSPDPSASTSLREGSSPPSLQD